MKSLSILEKFNVKLNFVRMLKANVIVLTTHAKRLV